MNSNTFSFSLDKQKNSFLNKNKNEKQLRHEIKKQTLSITKIIFYIRSLKNYSLSINQIMIIYSKRFADIMMLQKRETQPRFLSILKIAITKMNILKGILCLNIDVASNYNDFIASNIFIIVEALNDQSNLIELKKNNTVIYLKRLCQLALIIIAKKNNKNYELYENFLMKIFKKENNFPFKEQIINKKIAKILLKFFEKQENLKSLIYKKIIKLMLNSKFIENNQKIELISFIFNTSNSINYLFKRPSSEFFNLILNKETLTILKTKNINQNNIISNLNDFLKIFKDYILIQKNSKNLLEIIEFLNSFSSKIQWEELKTEYSVFFEDWLLSEISNAIKIEFTNKTVFNDENLSAIGQISQLYTNLFQIRSFEKKDNLRKVSFSIDFLELLFQIFSIGKFKVTDFHLKSQIFFKIYYLFIRLYHQRLILMDESDFFGVSVQKTNFSLGELKEFCSFLNEFVFKAFFQENILKTQMIDFKKTRKISINLLRELYDRDCLNQFLPKNFWIIPDANNLQDYTNSLKNEIPHVLGFEFRAKQLLKSIKKNMDKQKRHYYEEDEDLDRTIRIRRGFEVEDGLENFSGKQLRNLIQINYVNEHGIEEMGIDGGGILKEFLTVVCKKAFSPDYGLFIETEDNILTPNPFAEKIHPNNFKELYYFLGALTGKAMYENILIEPVFTRPFLNLLLDRKNQLIELKFLDKVLYKNLMFLKHCEDDNLIKEMALTFSYVESFMGEKILINLKPMGVNIEVTRENKLEFITELCNYKLKKQIETQAKYFLSGFQKVMKIKWLSMFNQEELQLLISGKKGLNVVDLRENVVFKGFTDEDLTIQHLWEILGEFSEEDQKLFLLFVTSCSRPPIMGFKSLNPPFCIQKMDYGGYYYGTDETERLPTSSTCMNILRMPNYENKLKMKNKILYAIRAKSGFELS